MADNKNMNVEVAEVAEAKTEAKTPETTTKTAEKKTAKKPAKTTTKKTGKNTTKKTNKKTEPVLKKLSLVSVKNDGMSVEDFTMEVPTFVKSSEIFFKNVQALYFQTATNNFETQINTINDSLKNEPGDTMNRRTLEQKKEYLEGAIAKLDELYSDIAGECQDADNDRVANLFIIAAGLKRIKDVDGAMDGIYNNVVKHYDIYIAGQSDKESEETVKLRTDSFKTIRTKLQKYLAGQLNTDSGEEYNEHKLNKLTAGFVNDVISYTYDATKIDGRSTNKKVASGAFKSRRKRATTVYVEILAKYFQLYQLNGKN